jgi:hypothetical protein
MIIVKMKKECVLLHSYPMLWSQERLLERNISNNYKRLPRNKKESHSVFFGHREEANSIWRNNSNLDSGFQH